MNIRDIMNYWEQKAPLDTAEDWDNPGLLVGSPDAPVTHILTTLDITPGAVEQAKRMGAELIISHHPVIFSPLRRMDADSVPYRLASNGIAALCLHTNLDKAAGGVNDRLANQLGWTVTGTAPDGLCRFASLPVPLSPDAFAAHVAQRLHTAVRMAEGGKIAIATVALCGGSGADCLLPLTERVDAVLTGEIKHHEWLAFAAAGVAALDGGHYFTEAGIADVLSRETAAAFPTLAVMAFLDQPPYTTICPSAGL